MWDRLNCIKDVTVGIDPSQDSTGRPSANADPDPDCCGGFKVDKIVPRKRCSSSVDETSNFQVGLLYLPVNHIFLCYFGGLMLRELCAL